MIATVSRWRIAIANSTVKKQASVSAHNVHSSLHFFDVVFNQHTEFREQPFFRVCSDGAEDEAHTCSKVARRELIRCLSMLLLQDAEIARLRCY